MLSIRYRISLMPQPLPRYVALELQHREDAAKLARILVETDGPAEPHIRPSARGGDWQRMRGVPCVGPGIGGTSPGTDPVRALLAKERRGASPDSTPARHFTAYTTCTTTV
jgi:hypothetical protein